MANTVFLEFDQLQNGKEREQRFLRIVQRIHEDDYLELLNRFDSFSDESFRATALSLMVKNAPSKWLPEIKERIRTLKHESKKEELLSLTSYNESKNDNKERGLSIKGYSKLYEKLKPIITTIWVLILLLIIIPLFGRVALSFSSNSPHSYLFQSDAYAATLSFQDNTNESIRLETARARDKAREYASDELDEWIDEVLKPKVESEFLGQYFNYFNRKKVEYTAIVRSISGKNAGTAAVSDFEKDFSRLVLNPSLAQRKISRITRESVNIFFRELAQQSPEISDNYSIAIEELEEMVGEVSNNNLSSSVDKNIGEAGIFTSVKIAPIAAKATEKIAIKLGAKAGAKAGATALGEILDPLAVIAIVGYEVYDYRHEVSTGKPQLRAAIFDYFDDMKSEILDGEGNSIMSVVKAQERAVWDRFDDINRKRWFHL